MRSNTAILFFYREEIREAEARSWTSSLRLNRNLAHRLLNHTRKCLSSSSISVFNLPDHDQCGQTFGERITNGIQKAFNIGYERLIVIGSDTIDLTVKDIESAGEHIANGQHLIGPAKDGGVFLFTMDRQSFDHGALLNLPWCSDALCTELEAYYAAREKTVNRLIEKADLDSGINLFSPYFIHAALSLIMGLFVSWNRCVNADFGHVNFFDQEMPRRGPPHYRITLV